MNIKELCKINDESYRKACLTEGTLGKFRQMNVFEQLSITLKLEELKLLSPNNEIKADLANPQLEDSEELQEYDRSYDIKELYFFCNEIGNRFNFLMHYFPKEYKEILENTDNLRKIMMSIMLKEDIK